MTNRRKRLGLLIFFTALAGCVSHHVREPEVRWPAAQLLPTFPAPATNLDCIDLTHATRAEMDLFVSLQGLVNRAQPRIACVVSNRGESKFTWLDLHKLHYRETDGYDVVLKYRGEVAGLVVTDPAQPDTLNLATTMAGVNNELICAPSLLHKLTNAPCNLPVLDDLRGRFADKYAVYRYLYSRYWSNCTHRVIAGMSPNAHGDLRDYLVALKSAAVWLNPANKQDAALLRQFVSGIKPLDGVYMGWWPGESDGLNWIAAYGIPVLASDFFRNATVFSGVSSPIRVPEIPPTPPLENKVYVSLILSDGDNVQYMQHGLKEIWNNPVRGAIPIGWTVSPLAVDLDPAMLDFYWTTATTNDCLVSGPSGAGYTHMDRWNATNLAAFAHVSSSYLERGGLRVITVWDKVNRSVARAFATNCPDLLGLTDQRGKYSAVNLGLRTIRLTPPYTSKVDEMISSITNAAAGWNGKQPLFIAAQADVWHIGPSGLAKVAAALDPAEYKVVRPDHLFLMARQANKK
jgi:hypothetical protein